MSPETAELNRVGQRWTGGEVVIWGGFPGQCTQGGSRRTLHMRASGVAFEPLVLANNLGDPGLGDVGLAGKAHAKNLLAAGKQRGTEGHRVTKRVKPHVCPHHTEQSVTRRRHQQGCSTQKAKVHAWTYGQDCCRQLHAWTYGKDCYRQLHAWTYGKDCCRQPQARMQHTQTEKTKHVDVLASTHTFSTSAATGAAAVVALRRGEAAAASSLQTDHGAGRATAHDSRAMSVGSWCWAARGGGG